MILDDSLEAVLNEHPKHIFQTGKINQGNIALKRVVESIANGDSHVPFRDSKLTMLLQVSLAFYTQCFINDC